MRKTRLFKFLVISDEVMKKYGSFIPRVNYTTGRVLNTKNKFYRIDEQDKKLCFMSLDYPNAGHFFNDSNKAYVVINEDEIEEIMTHISPSSNEKRGRFRCIIRDCVMCHELKKECRDKDMTMKISRNNIRGRQWCFAYDQAGTKGEMVEFKFGIRFAGRIEPKTGGIVYSSLQWRGGERPDAFKSKTIAVPLHHWIKCHSIPKKPLRDSDYSYYQIGHTFDNREEFIGLATKKEQEYIHNEIEPKNNIWRSMRVQVGESCFSRMLECKCGQAESTSKCKRCPGVLYIDSDDRFENLCKQLLSDEYKQLIEMKNK